jgi:hypothetical protein
MQTVQMRYRMSCVDGNYGGYSETLDGYTFDNLRGYGSPEDLFDALDAGMQDAADAHGKIYEVVKFMIHPPGSMPTPSPRRFVPKFR